MLHSDAVSPASPPPAANGAAKLPLTVLDTTTTVKGRAILRDDSDAMTDSQAGRQPLDD